jgi:hypothetical protein
MKEKVKSKKTHKKDKLLQDHTLSRDEHGFFFRPRVTGGKLRVGDKTTEPGVAVDEVLLLEVEEEQ